MSTIELSHVHLSDDPSLDVEDKTLRRSEGGDCRTNGAGNNFQLLIWLYTP